MMSSVTQISSALQTGCSKAADELLPLVYQELRCLATLNRLTYQKRSVEAGEKLVIRLNNGGGQAMRIQPVKERRE